MPRLAPVALLALAALGSAPRLTAADPKPLSFRLTVDPGSAW